MEKEVIALTSEEMKLLLEVLDYTVEEDGQIKDNKGIIQKCPFTGTPAKLNQLSIMPGSVILMNTSPVTLSEYFYQYPDE